MSANSGIRSANIPCSSHSLNSERIRLNVGGFRFETTLSTLTRDPGSMLERMFSEDWQNRDKLANEETFIDRDGRHFHVILNFLRDGPSVALPESTDSLEEVLREAEYFQLMGLVELCKLRLHQPFRPIKEGEVVTWRQDCVEAYWRPFALSLIQDGVEMGFLFDRVGKKYNDKQTIATCFGCMSKFVLDQITVFDYRLRFEEWEGLKHHMRQMRGVVVEAVGQTCCVVNWGNGKRLHVPCTALIPADICSPSLS